MKLHNFSGCGNCPIVKRCSDKKVPVSVTFLADQLADNWGRFVKVFGKGETVKGSAIVDGDTIYCITARHELLDYSDFISLEQIEVKMN